MFLYTKDNYELHLKYGLNMLYYQEGFYWQPFTSMFMHANWNHLLMNMAVLFQFGVLLERDLNAHLKYLLIYILGGLLTSYISLYYISHFEPNTNLVGASGALSVLFGWFAKRDKNLRYGLIVTILLISFVPNLFGMNVAWYAHLIGFGIGWLVGYIL
jgi:membrane associated rhomboid family serine protease